jgi:hypothetical protein
MGFWQGLNAGLTSVLEEKARKEERQQEIDLRAAERAEDRKERRDALNTELFEKYRTTVLEVAAKRGEEGKEQDKKIRLAGSLGLTEMTVDALLRSGQLDLFLSAYEKNQKVDPRFVTDLNTFIETQFRDASPETIAGALVAGVSTDRDVTDRDESQLAITEAILSASTPEELDDLYTKLLTAGETYTPLPRFEVDFGTVAGPEEAETKAMRREIAEGLNTYFANSFTVTDSGDVVVNQNADSSVKQVFNEAERKARELSFGPTRDFTPTDAANYVVTQLETAITGTQGQAKPVDLLTNFDEILANPGGFVEAYQPPPVVDTPEVVTPEGNVEALGDTGFNYIVESTN